MAKTSFHIFELLKQDPQQSTTCWKSTIETLEKRVKCVQI